MENLVTENSAASLPNSLKVSDIARFLGIAASTAYKLVKTPGFPVVRMPGIRRIVISRDKFLEWCVNASIDGTQIK